MEPPFSKSEKVQSLGLWYYFLCLELDSLLDPGGDDGPSDVEPVFVVLDGPVVDGPFAQSVQLVDAPVERNVRHVVIRVFLLAYKYSLLKQMKSY